MSLVNRSVLNQLITTVAVIFISTVLISSCATRTTMTQSELKDAYNSFIDSEKLESKRRVTSFRLQGWSDLGDEHLILTANVNRYYLISLNQPCLNLQYANTIVVNNPDTILERKFDSISVPGYLGFKCFIKDIYQVTKDQRNAIQKIGKIDDEETSEMKAVSTTEVMSPEAKIEP